jgi:hypothetical protein
MRQTAKTRNNVLPFHATILFDCCWAACSIAIAALASSVFADNKINNNDNNNITDGSRASSSS